MRELSQIQSTAFDLIVIGGGINGAGVARDAALRGLKPILIDKSDFGSGTTSWSTRLVHGGLRYLESFELKLVRESLREREILLRTAPHLVQPIQMTIPIYRGGSRSYWEIQAGMLLYDVLSFDKSLLSHRMLPRRKFRQLFREINPDGLVGAAQYFDAQAKYAERLCLETVLSAQAAGATVLNYVKVIELHRRGDRLHAITCADQRTGEVFQIQGSDRAIFINTSGPWVDQVLQSDRTPAMSHSPKIGGTKGSHIIVAPFSGAPQTALYVEARTDQRPFFIVPWLDRYLIGTTDLHYSGDLDRVKASPEEIDYLISETNQIFPSAKLTRQSVQFTYSGVRPLPYAAGKNPGSITRNHILYDHSAEGITNLISLIGGKLTTYRRVGEEMVNAVYQKWGRSAPPCPTRHQPLPGAILPTDPRIAEAIDTYQSSVNPASIHHLFWLYGAKANEVLALTDASPDLTEPIVSGLPDIKAQVVYAIQSEMAHTLVDICHRRTTLAMQANYGFDALPALTATLQTHCGWNEAACDRQLADYVTYLQDNCLPDFTPTADLKAISSQSTVSLG